MSDAPPPSFYWHDYETWGEVPSLDRPSQFAGVRTDWDLNPIGSPLMIYSKPTPDFLPKPEACLVTGLSPFVALQKGLVEAEFIRHIHAQLSQPNTCGVGYNSIRFDDEVTRHTLYRNFYDPYEREWRNGNSRWDLIDVVRMTHALRPEGIIWPVRDDGYPSFRLEDLTKANGLSHESAHDALSDVYATIELARLIKSKQPKLFEYALGLRNKRKVSQLVDPEDAKPVLHISSRFGPRNQYAAVVFPLMAHPTNKNAITCFNLGCNPQVLLSLDEAELRERLFTPLDQQPEGREPIGLKDIHLNKSPMVLPVAMLDASVNERLGIDKAACETNWRWFQALSRDEWDHIRNKLELLLTRTHTEEKDVDQQLYDGFFGDGDKLKMLSVRRAFPEELAQLNSAFEDPRLTELLFRYRARNYPETLMPDELLQWFQLCQARINRVSGGFDDWELRLTRLLDQPTLGAEQQRLLLVLQDYATELKCQIQIS